MIRLNIPSAVLPVLQFLVSSKLDCEQSPIFSKVRRAPRNTQWPVYKTAYPVAKRGDFCGLMTNPEHFFSDSFCPLHADA